MWSTKKMDAQTFVFHDLQRTGALRNQTFY